MNRSTLVVAPLLLAITQSACTVVPPLAPIERKPMQQPRQPERIAKISLGELLAKYAPPNFEYDPQAQDVDFSRPVSFDSSLPWAMAFEKALSGAGIDRSTLKPPQAQSIAAEPESPAAVETHSVAMVSQADEAKLSNSAGRNAIESAGLATGAAAQGQAVMMPAVQKCVADQSFNGEPLQVWDAPSNASLKQTLEGWSRNAGWEVSWAYVDEQTNTATDLTLGGGKKCQGSYKDAVRTLIDSLPEGDHVVAEMWSGNSPPLLRVFNKGKENK